LHAAHIVRVNATKLAVFGDKAPAASFCFGALMNQEHETAALKKTNPVSE
jgi:hypothetical protein